MNIKFDLGKKNGKVNDIKADELDEKFDDEEKDADVSDDYDDEEDLDTSSTSSKKGSSSLINNDFKKFLIKLAFIIIGGIILLFVVLSLASLGGKTYSYERIEEIMTTAAESYFSDYSENLPKTELQVVEVETATLSQHGYMKDLSEYTKKGVSCTGKVSVTKSGNDYVYTPNLNCGESYASKTLSSAILEDSKVVTSGYGLYQMNSNYVFRGEKVNNYVQLGETLWRIVKMDSNHNMYLVINEYAGYTTSWDDRYNKNLDYGSGINNYSSSRIKEYLEEIYNEEKEGIRIFTDDDRTKLSLLDVCSAKRDATSKTNNNSIECKTTEKAQKLGLLTISDYINASIDPDCTSASSVSCQNYNYLAIKTGWWTSTAVANSTAYAYAVGSNGVIRATRCSDYNNVRPVIKLSSRIMITTGDGTENNPYVIK